MFTSIGDIVEVVSTPAATMGDKDFDGYEIGHLDDGRHYGGSEHMP
jgi:hypothetical protein